MERTIDGHALEVRKLTPPGAEQRIHENVGLKRTAEPALTPARAARQRRDLAVILG